MMKWNQGNDAYVHCGDYKINHYAIDGSLLFDVWFRHELLCTCDSLAKAKGAVAFHSEGKLALSNATVAA